MGIRIDRYVLPAFLIMVGALILLVVLSGAVYLTVPLIKTLSYTAIGVFFIGVGIMVHYVARGE